MNETDILFNKEVGVIQSIICEVVEEYYSCIEKMLLQYGISKSFVENNAKDFYLEQYNDPIGDTTIHYYYKGIELFYAEKHQYLDKLTFTIYPKYSERFNLL